MADGGGVGRAGERYNADLTTTDGMPPPANGARPQVPNGLPRTSPGIGPAPSQPAPAIGETTSNSVKVWPASLECRVRAAVGASETKTPCGRAARSFVNSLTGVEVAEDGCGGCEWAVRVGGAG
eukprot:406614-Rhodomonas_salina.1